MPEADLAPETQTLVPGDRIRYGMSVGLVDDVWLKLDADVQVQEGETAAQVWTRVSTLVERLLTRRADSFQAEMKASKR